MRKRTLGLIALATIACLGPMLLADTEVEKSKGAGKELELVTVKEARGRVRLLHEVIRGALQVMHRDFFDEDDAGRIPSSSLEEMFEAVEEEHGVKLKWLGVNAKIMNSDHKAVDEFEKKAVKAIAGGAQEFDSVEGKSLRFVGAIRLHNSCLKCHVPFRDSLETRFAGLSISIPVQLADSELISDTEQK
jgi:hypothetical protein